MRAKCCFSMVLGVLVWSMSLTCWADRGASSLKLVDLSVSSLKLPSVKLKVKKHSQSKRWLAVDDSQGEMINEKRAKPRPVVRKKAKPKKKHRRYGIELRGGLLFFPEFMLNALFFDESEGIMQGSFGAAFILRTDKTFEYVFGVSYNFFQFQEGKDNNGKPIPHVFLNKSDPTFQREFVQNNLSYLAIDVRFQKSFDLHPRFHILLGGGIGLGVVLGQIRRTDTFIPGYTTSKEEEYKQAYKLWRANPKDQSALPNLGCNVKGDTPVQQASFVKDKIRQDCSQIEAVETRVPPVIPVFNFILGMVFPLVIDRWDIRIQGGFGLPRLFWVSAATHIYF